MFEFSGIRQLERKMAHELKKVEGATNKGLVEAAEYLLAASQPLVPVDTGRLKKSGKVTVMANNRVFVSYQAFNPTTGYEYAPIQHEATWFRHRIGTAKYLETPFRQGMKTMISIVGEHVTKEVKK